MYVDIPFKDGVTVQIKRTLYKYQLDYLRRVNKEKPGECALVMRYGSPPCFMIFPKSYIRLRIDTGLRVIATTVEDRVIGVI